MIIHVKREGYTDILGADIELRAGWMGWVSVCVYTITS